MTDTGIMEQYFKARGWDRVKKPPHVWVKDKVLVWAYVELPPILTDFPAFKQHVLEVMGKERLHLYVNTYEEYNEVNWRGKCGEAVAWENIDNNNILHAAVIAATRYWKEK